MDNNKLILSLIEIIDKLHGEIKFLKIENGMLLDKQYLLEKENVMLEQELVQLTKEMETNSELIKCLMETKY